MKGYKTCPECQKKVPCAIMKCQCGFTFEKAAPKAKFWDEGGKGRKQCRNCEKFIGARSAKCPNCEHDLSKDPKASIKKADGDPMWYDFEGAKWAHAFGWNGKITLVAAGKCPVKLQGDSFEEVEQWFEQVLNYGHNTLNTHFAPTTFRLWAQRQLPLGEAGQAIEHINMIVESYDFTESKVEQESFA